MLLDFQGGDELALKVLYDLHQAALHSYIARLVGNADEAEDVLTESFVRLWNKRKQFADIKSVIHYLYAIARNLTYDLLRAKQNRVKQHEGYAYWQLIQEQLVSEEVRARLLQHIFIEVEQLPDQMKKVFTMAYVHGIDAASIADLLQLSVHTVHNHKKAGMKKIRNALGKKGFTKWSYVFVMCLLF